MSKAIIPRNKIDAIEKLLAQGDLAPMLPEQRLDYMRTMCKLLGISMLGTPFDFIKFQGQVKMYANSKCAAQLRAVYKISIKIVSCERVDGLYVTNLEARTGKGREDADIGAINIKGLSGEALANAMMKGVTKGKRRVTLSLCGLGMLDADTAKEIAEMEAKQKSERAVEETTEKLAQTTERPEFEENRPQGPSVSPEAANSNPRPNYVLKAGKIKGKTLDQVPVKKLQDWVKWYEGQVQAGKSLHADIQDDAFHIYPFLEERKIMAEQLPLEGQ